MPLKCCTWLVFMFCASRCAAFGQMPSKNPAPPPLPAEIEKAPAALAGMEAGLRRDLEANPDSALLLYKLGLVLRQEKKPKESLETYTRTAKFQKPNADQLRSVALDYVLLDDYADAVHWLELAASFEPANVDVLYSLGRCLYSQNKFPEAEGAFLRVLALKPDHLKAEENLGLVYDYSSKPDQAEATFRKAVDWAGTESTDEWPFQDLGTFLLDHNRPEEAVPYFQRAASIAPKSAVCHEKLGRALVDSGKAQDGVKELDKAAQLDPKNPKTHFELGHAWRAVGNLDKSRAEFALSQSLYGQHSDD